MAAREPHYVTPQGGDGGPAWTPPVQDLPAAESDAEQTQIIGRGTRRAGMPDGEAPPSRTTGAHRTVSGPRLAAVPTWTRQHPAAAASEPEPEAEPWEPPRTMPPRPEPEPEPVPPMVLTEADLHAIADMLACYTLTPERLHRLVRDAVHAERHAFAAETVRLLLGRGKARVRRALRLRGKNTTKRGNTR